MTWVFAVVIVAVLGAVAVVATGRGGQMSPAYDDRRDVRVQADGPLTADDLAEVRFTTALRGYRASEVDALLDRLIAEMHERSQVRGAPVTPGQLRESDPTQPPSGDAGPAGRPPA